MSSLREFLASEADKLGGEYAKAMGKRDEWTASVERLFGQIKEWLDDADTRKILTITEGRMAFREVGIGNYEAPFLLVEIGVRQVSIRPVARNVAGAVASTGAIDILQAYGRVDMASPLEKYMLFRTAREPEDRWIIIGEDQYRSQPLDRESFEAAFRRLLE